MIWLALDPGFLHNALGALTGLFTKPEQYAELESEKPEARPDPTVNTDGKPKAPPAKRKKRKRRAGSQ